MMQASEFDLFKRILYSAGNNTTVSGLINLMEQADGKRPNLLRVLTYHRVDEPGADPSAYHRVTVTPEDFDLQMRFLAANYHVLSMQELLNVYPSGGLLPPRSVLVTFDDAYRDFATNAWPILNHYHLPVTLFVPTAFPGNPGHIFWWDRLHQAIYRTPYQYFDTPVGRLSFSTLAERKQAFNRLRDYMKSLPHSEAMAWVEQACKELGFLGVENTVMGWEQLRQLARQGVSLGAHTRTHPMLNQISLEEVRSEVCESLEDLQREIGEVLPVFAYPSGGFTDATVDILKQAGILLAFTTVRGVNDLTRADQLLLRRINVGFRTTLMLLRSQLLPWFVHFNRLQQV